MLMLCMTCCSTVKHVPDGKYLLDDVKIVVERDDDCARDVTPSSLTPYLRQTPNSRMLGLFKMQLATYSLSGRDSTKAVNRWLRRLGQPPVIFSTDLTQRSVQQLRLSLNNMGYNEASVVVDSCPRPDKKKITLTYNVKPGCPQYVRALTYQIPDTALATEIFAIPDGAQLQRGMIFDRNALETARIAITDHLRRRGYYAFVKDYITFLADTAKGSKDVDLTMVVKPPYQPNGAPGNPGDVHAKYRFSHVYFVTDGQKQLLTGDTISIAAADTVNYRGITVLYGDDRYLKPSILDEKCFIQPGMPYSTVPIDRTYEALSQLSILNYINIVTRPAGMANGEEQLDVYVFLSRGKKQSVSFEVEGTNSEGDLGFGVALNYAHRDIAHRGEVFSTKLSASYESLSGNFEGLINNSYTELGAEVGLSFPRFVFPFLSRSYKRNVRATSEVSLNFNFQQRPEYTRVIAGAGWKYQWSNRRGTERRTFDMVDVSVVSLPRSTIDFLNTVAPLNPLLRYSYEDHLIMRMAFSYFRTNRRNNIGLGSAKRSTPLQQNIYTLRTSVETAGNLLYAISSIDGQKRKDGVYKIFGIQYAQYIKSDIDYSRVYILDYRNAFAIRGYLGLSTPYGNSSMIPFEKRFYAGGANGVRGWSVRSLGPGRFPATNSVTDFINQCGDISLILTAEYRFKMFWVLEGALFVDAGNIWTVRDYENQPGGLFRFNNFYKQIAASYGIGVRLDFTYFLVRLDLGMKAHNPAINQQPWPLVHPKFSRDAAFHFSVGYPF